MLNDATMRGAGESQPMLPPECVCGESGDTPLSAALPGNEPACFTPCGESRVQVADAPRRERQERRRLQELLSAFV